MVRSRVILAALFVAVPAWAAAPAWAAEDMLGVAIGKNLFDRSWVSAPSSTSAADGLGPHIDASSCVACHRAEEFLHADDTTVSVGTVTRVGNAQGTGDPVYGYQFQMRGARGQRGEGALDLSWAERDGLRVPVITVVRLEFGPFAQSINLATNLVTRLGLRRAPPLAGVGLLARVPEDEILKRAGAEDAAVNGISGKPSWTIGADGVRRLGRFGWKAGQPDLRSQTEMAFSRDLGMSTAGQPDPWGDCTDAQAVCRSAPHGAGPGEVEISDDIVGLIVAFLDSLPPRERRAPDARGEHIFAQTGCASCHTTLQTADGTPVHAYTDLLLHDMGPGLDDGIREGNAQPAEWRTAPLWDVPYSLKAGGLLHDGRARSVEEAVQWHGGEAEAARARFNALSQDDRAALVAFLGGL